LDFGVDRNSGYVPFTNDIEKASKANNTLVVISQSNDVIALIATDFSEEKT
jgi:hypothetical protein